MPHLRSQSNRSSAFSSSPVDLGPRSRGRSWTLLLNRLGPAGEIIGQPRPSSHLRTLAGDSALPGSRPPPVGMDGHGYLLSCLLLVRRGVGEDGAEFGGLLVDGLRAVAGEQAYGRLPGQLRGGDVGGGRDGEAGFLD